jgi:hypothetical protein
MADIDGTIDVDCDADFKPDMPSVSGMVALGQRLKRRLTTDTGRWPFWDPDDGFDLLALLLSKASPGWIVDQVQIQCMKDEQVEAAIATITPTGANSYQLRVAIVAADGPYELTMDINTATQELVTRIKEAT